MRQIKRFYLLAQREDTRRQLFLARLQGWQGQDPDWLEDRVAEPASEATIGPPGSVRVLTPGPDGERIIMADDPRVHGYR